MDKGQGETARDQKYTNNEQELILTQSNLFTASLSCASQLRFDLELYIECYTGKLLLCLRDMCVLDYLTATLHLQPNTQHLFLPLHYMGKPALELLRIPWAKRS